MHTDRTPLFVRLPAPLLSDLDAHIAADGRTKQAVVEELLASQLRSSDRAAPTAEPEHDEILDLGETAALLRVAEADVLERIAGGGFPARRFGDRWRVSRSAVIAWLHGTDSPTDRRTGFGSA